MKFHIDNLWRLTLMAMLALMPVMPIWADVNQKQQSTNHYRMRPDTIRPISQRVEVPQLHVRMMTSPLPVEIKQQGRQLCIKSQYNQMLPIYTANGTLYSSMRLTKGTNWLTGLPRGAYMINNQRYTIN